MLSDKSYPLVTHDPNMLKKVTGNLLGKIKKCLFSRREKHKFLLETNKMYQIHDIIYIPRNKKCVYIIALWKSRHYSRSYFQSLFVRDTTRLLSRTNGKRERT